MALAATPPDFNNNRSSYRTRSSVRTGNRNDPRFRSNQDHEDPREKYWKNNHAVIKQSSWGSVVGQFPIVAPVEEDVTLKNAIFNTLTERVENNTGTWVDKTDFYMASFEDIVPAAKTQGIMATVSMDDISSDVFSFADMEIVDASLLVIPRGAQVDFTDHQRARTRYLRFTLTVSPRLIIPGDMDFDPDTFPTPTSNTVYVRALIQNGGLAPGISKNLLDQTPKLALLFYTQANVEFDISIKHRSDAAPDQEKYEKWLREVHSKTKFYALQHYIRLSYVGRLEGTETLAQRLTRLCQRIVDPSSQQVRCQSVRELHQSFQFLITEIKGHAPPADVPQLDSLASYRRSATI